MLTMDDVQRFYVDVIGSSDVPVVLLHAGIADSSMWDAQWEAFSEQFQTIRYDYSGYGRTPLPENWQGHRAELLALLDARGIDRVHLVGASMGGELALDFTLDHPERVASLTMVGSTPSGFEMQGEPPALIGPLFEALEQGNVPEVGRIAAQLWGVGENRDADSVNQAMLDQIAHMMEQAILQGGFMVAEAAPLNPPAAGRLQDVEVPTLILVGSDDHPEVHRAADELSASIPYAQRGTLEGTAHLPNMEAPESFNEVVLSFLQSVG